MSKLLAVLLAEAPAGDAGRSTWSDGDRLLSWALPADLFDAKSLKSCDGSCGGFFLEGATELLRASELEAGSGFCCDAEPLARRGLCEATDECEVLEPWEALRVSDCIRASFSLEYW
jgi:hypothetical protein